MKSKKYSFIIPVYNGEKTIERCLNSILEQSCKDYEIIVINDGSNDRTKEIVKKYKGIRLINVENGGQGKARNLGIKKAVGEYILFVDADDYIDEKLLETINNVRDLTKYDLIKYKYSIYNNKLKIIEEDLPNIKGNIIDDSTKLLAKKYYFSVDSAYKREFIIKNKITFGEGYIYEDYEFWLKACIKANKSYVLYKPLYNIIKNENSSTFNNRETDFHFDSFDLSIKACKKIVQNEKLNENINYFYRYLLNRFLSYYQKRVPSSFKKQFLKSFVDDMSEFNIKTFHNKKYDILLKYNVLKEKKYLVMRLYCITYIIKNRKR